MADVTIKICDRCKKEIKDRRGIAVFEPVFIRSIFSVELFRRGLYGGCDKFRKNQFDFCEDCSNKLMWFIEGAELMLEAEESPEEATDA